MISTVISRGKIIDCRLFKVSGEFVELTEIQVNRLATSLFYQTSDLFADKCFLNWTFEGRKVCSIEKSLATQKMRNGCFSLLLEGDVLSEFVFNAKSYRNNERTCIYNMLPRSSFSQDYESYYIHNLLDYSGDCLKKNVIKTFSEVGRYYKGYYNSHDIQGMFSATCERTRGLFYGKFELEVSVYSLASEVEKTSEIFVQYLKHISLEFGNINARISIAPALQTMSNWHCFYFGALPMYINSTNDNFRLWRGAMYTYLLGAEWFNIVSPRTLSELSSSKNPYDDGLLSIENLSNGALVVKCLPNILTANETDIKNVKACLYNYLLPGRKEITLDALRTNITSAPRHLWEICPIFDNELEVTNDKLIFQHTGIFNPGKLNIDNW